MATATDTFNQATENIKNKAGEAATAAADKAKQAASTFGQKAEDCTHAVGSGMKNLAETMRQRGPQEGMAAAATSSLAQGLESGGQYLEEEGIKGIAGDVTNLIRRNPLPALLLGVGLGFILARATTRR